MNSVCRAFPVSSTFCSPKRKEKFGYVKKQINEVFNGGSSISFTLFLSRVPCIGCL